MAAYHEVHQGEHVAGIAWNYGFQKFETIWNHPENADIKGKRNPNVLFPGDEVFIPDLQHQEYARPTDQLHKFVRPRSVLKLKLTLEVQYDQPISAAPCSLTVDFTDNRLTTDGQGELELVIPPSAKCSLLTIQDADQKAYVNERLVLQVGHLDPVEEVSGQQGRLRNLGYFVGDVDGEVGSQFSSAVEEFQCDQELTVDGICGPRTQARLKQVCGC